MMITVNRIENSITGSANGKSYGVKYTEEKYKKMLELAAKANEAEKMDDLLNILQDFEPFTKDGYKETIETACPNILVNEETGKFYLKTTDGNVISSRPLPQPFVDRILKSVEMNIDFLPIIKMWTRFLRNPNYSDKKALRFANYVNKTIVDYDLKAELEKEGVAPAVAIERSTVFQTPVTNEGLICTYKVSREILHKFDPKTREQKPRYEKTYDEDSGEVAESGLPQHVEDRLFEPYVMGQRYDAFYCYEIGASLQKGTAKHFIKVGRVHELEKWEQVDCNDNYTGAPGLHTGNREYIAGYASGAEAETHNVFVDPADIGAITDDGSGALRVRKYYVHSSNAGINRSVYHSSKYAAMNDLEWNDYREAAIKESEEKAAKAQALANEQASI